MPLEHCVAFVTGANRGVGECFVHMLLQRGAKKVYAGARNIDALRYADDRVVPVELDITDDSQVRRAAALAIDTTLLINNAGLNCMEPALAASDMNAARTEMEVNYFGTLNMMRAEVNYFGTLNMMRAFAPALPAGGAIVNLLSILARVTLPSMASLCASKAASLRMTEGVRAELRPRGIRVISVLPGAIDTDMSRDFPPPKISAAEVVEATLSALDDGTNELYVGAMAQEIAAGLAYNRDAIQSSLAGAN